MEKVKTCSKCKEDRDICSFYKRDSSKDGLRNTCIICINKRKKELAICGIYKITSPSGKVYIGQSKDIKTRWSSYKTRGCEKQIKLQKSFNKYTVEKHDFEIIEKCSHKKLDSRERYWQDFYNAVNEGLNCLLTNSNIDYTLLKNKKEKHIKNQIVSWYIDDIIDLETGVFYYSVKEASVHVSVGVIYLGDMLRGKVRNKTSLLRGSDYEKGLLPNTLFTPKPRAKNKIRKLVFDYDTLKVVGSISEAASLSSIKETTLRSYLNGVATNKTNFIYLEDYNKGLTPKDICNTRIQKIKVINFITKDIFETINEASIFYKTYPKKK